jgi:hypothetical protein
MAAASEPDDRAAALGAGPVTSEGVSDAEAGVDPRMRSAWRSWLSALATDAEAAMAAALAYESLPDDGRAAWLDALEADAADLDVPPVALYAPLLAVETNELLRARMLGVLASRGVAFSPPATARALHGVGPDGARVCVVLSPLYLDFVELLVCRYDPDAGILSARRDPVRHILDVLGVHAGQAASPLESGVSAAVREPPCVVDGVAVTEVPLRVVVEELAHAVVADRREGRSAPAALSNYAHLFGPDLETPPASQP